MIADTGRLISAFLFGSSTRPSKLACQPPFRGPLDKVGPKVEVLDSTKCNLQPIKRHGRREAPDSEQLAIGLALVVPKSKEKK